MNKVDVLCDLQYGSTGKGLFAGYLAHMGDYTATVSANMPNAGHTFVDGDSKWIFKALPIAAVSSKVRAVFIGPGAVFKIDQLLSEWEQVPDAESKTLYIHECAGILAPHHAEQERNELNHIASTMQGSTGPMIEKIMRNPNNDPRAKGWITGRPNIRVIDQEDYLGRLHQHTNILVEGSQGYSLGNNAGFWPYCTSRDCTPARILSDCSVPVQWLRHTYGTLRTFPIRVGNTDGGSSGPVYTDQEELTWREIGVEKEMTTVTGRVRRVFSFSWQQYQEAWRACQPDFLFLNFVNYMPQPDTFLYKVFDKHKGWGGEHMMYYGMGPDLVDVRVYVE